MKAFGLEEEIADLPLEEEVEPACCEIWPENLTTLRMFLAMATQWDLAVFEGEAVRTNLKYTALPVVRSGMRRKISGKEWPDIFEGIRSMEAAALKVIRERFQEKQSQQIQAQ
jgi:hypothetical protein